MWESDQKSKIKIASFFRVVARISHQTSVTKKDNVHIWYVLVSKQFDLVQNLRNRDILAIFLVLVPRKET